MTSDVRAGTTVPQPVMASDLSLECTRDFVTSEKMAIVFKR